MAADPMVGDAMVEALDGLMAFVDDCDAQLGRLLDAVDEKDAERVAPVLQRLRTYRQRLAQVEALAERHVARALGTGQHTPAGLPVKVHGGWDRKEWQHRDIARLLAERTLVDPLTGEFDPAMVRPAMLVVDAVLEACRPEWRVTALKAAGIELDGLCKEQPKRMTVQFLSPAETR